MTVVMRIGWEYGNIVLQERSRHQRFRAARQRQERFHRRFSTKAEARRPRQVHNGTRPFPVSEESVDMCGTGYTDSL